MKAAAGLKGAVDSVQGVKGAVDSATSKIDGFGGIVEGLKDKINGAAITNDSPAKSVENVRSSSSWLHFWLSNSRAGGQSRCCEPAKIVK